MNKEDTTPPPQKKKFTFDRNAKGVRELLSMKFDVMVPGMKHLALRNAVESGSSGETPEAERPVLPFSFASICAVLGVWHTTPWRKEPVAPCRMPYGVQA